MMLEQSELVQRAFISLCAPSSPGPHIVVISSSYPGATGQYHPRTALTRKNTPDFSYACSFRCPYNISFTLSAPHSSGYQLHRHDYPKTCNGGLVESEKSEHNLIRRMSLRGGG